MPLRPRTVETLCFEILLACVFTGFVVWCWGMFRKSFGAIPALLWLVLAGASLVCAAVIGIIEFTH